MRRKKKLKKACGRGPGPKSQGLPPPLGLEGGVNVRDEQGGANLLKWSCLREEKDDDTDRQRGEAKKTRGVPVKVSAQFHRGQRTEGGERSTCIT